MYLKIEADYENGVFIFKNGDLEIYLDIPKGQKGIASVINFCKNNLHVYWADDTNNRVAEIKMILSKVIERSID